MTTDPRIEAAARALYGDVNKPHARDKGWDEVLPRWQESYRSNATAALAAIDKAATITEAYALAEVPIGTVVRSAAGTIAARFDGYTGVVFGDERGFPWRDLALPARVIHWGTE